MKKIFVVRKFIAAETMEQAIALDKKTKPHDCFMDEHSTKMLSEELLERSGKKD